MQQNTRILRKALRHNNLQPFLDTGSTLKSGMNIDGLTKNQKSLSFRATARNLSSKALGTIKISPDGRNDIVTVWTFCEKNPLTSLFQRGVRGGFGRFEGYRNFQTGHDWNKSTKDTVHPELVEG
jgi:hypothetical protein